MNIVFVLCKRIMLCELCRNQEEKYNSN